MYNRSACTPPMILQKLLFYKAFLILFNIKEGPQSISIAKVDFGAASKNRIYLILILIITERPSWCLNQHFQGPEIQWEHYLANSNFCQVLMAILVVFSKWPLPKIQKFITFLVLDLYKQIWCQNMHFEGPEIQWRCCQVDRIFTFASSKLFDYLLK